MGEEKECNDEWEIWKMRRRNDTRSITCGEALMPNKQSILCCVMTFSLLIFNYWDCDVHFMWLHMLWQSSSCIIKWAYCVIRITLLIFLLLELRREIHMAISDVKTITLHYKCQSNPFYRSKFSFNFLLNLNSDVICTW